MNVRGRKLRAGVTLLECLLAAVVLAMTTSAMIFPFAAGAQCSAQDARQALGVTLAQDLMEEILSKSFSDPGGTPQREGSRGAWDDITDYDGYAESAGCITSFDGSTITDKSAAGMTRHCSVQGVYVTGQDTSEEPSFMQVEVSVKHQGREMMKLTRLVYANE